MARGWQKEDSMQNARRFTEKEYVDFNEEIHMLLSKMGYKHEGAGHYENPKNGSTVDAGFSVENAQFEMYFREYGEEVHFAIVRRDVRGWHVLETHPDGSGKWISTNYTKRKDVESHVQGFPQITLCECQE